MFIRSLIRPFFMLSVVDGGGGGEVSGGSTAAPLPPAAAPPAETPAAPAQDAPAAPAPPPSAPDILAADFDPATAIPDDALYRDAVPLREQVTKARQEYGPVAETLASLPEPVREAYTALTPAMGLARIDPTIAGDVSFLIGQYPNLDPGDQEVLRGIVADHRRDPGGTMASLRQAAEVLRSDPDEPGGTMVDPAGIAPETDDFGFELDDPERPLRAGELEERFAAWQAQNDQRAQVAAYQQQYANQVRTEMTQLGYDLTPEASPFDRERSSFILNRLASAPNETVASAHEYWLRTVQDEIITRFANGQLPNGSPRPGLPEGGAPPSSERRLSTLEAMDAAATERLTRGT